MNTVTEKCKNEVVIRRGATIDDIEGMLRVEKETWSEDQAFTREHFESHLKVFPEGIFIAEVDGEIAGVGVSELLDYDLAHPIPTWYEVSDEGFIAGTHNPNGKYLYGVSLSVSPRFSSLKLGSKMLEYCKNSIIQRRLDGFVIGSRVPRFSKFSTQMTIEQYISAKRGNRKIDPELEFYSQNGFDVIMPLPGYFEDPESLDYGVLMFWKNPK
ncbi:MAG: GNAT family N-acetyltransferase [Candidatus Berkelbacteria bacterium]